MLANPNIYNRALHLFDFESSIDPLSLLHGTIKKSHTDWFQDTVVKYDENLNIELKNSGTIKAKRLFIATNGYLNQIKQIQEKVNPVLAQIQHISFESNNGSFGLHGNYYHPELKIYFRQIESEQIILGGYRSLDEANEVGTHLKINNQIQKALFDYAKTNIFGDKIACKLERVWCGIMGFTQNGQPIIEQDCENPNAYIMAGFNGHGLGLIFYHAKNLVEKLNLC